MAAPDKEPEEKVAAKTISTISFADGERSSYLIVDCVTQLNAASDSRARAIC